MWSVPPSDSTIALERKRPSPVPWPGSLVVKNGSSARRRVASSMPGPLSSTSITTSPASPRARIRIWFWLTRLSVKAWPALTTKLTTTSMSLVRCAHARGTSSGLQWIVARWLTCARTSARAASIASGTATASTPSLPRAEVSRMLRTMSRTRQQPSSTESTSAASIRSPAASEARIAETPVTT